MAAPATIADYGSAVSVLYPNTQHPTPTREVCLGQIEAIPMGQGHAYRIGGEPIAVFRLRDGRVRAIENECPHRGGPLSEGLTGAGAVVCPFHAWKFDLETGDCFNDPCSLRTFPVRVEDGMIYLTIGLLK
jgi:nitrite reductase (NADH) small subunit